MYSKEWLSSDLVTLTLVSADSTVVPFKGRGVPASERGGDPTVEETAGVLHVPERHSSLINLCSSSWHAGMMACRESDQTTRTLSSL